MGTNLSPARESAIPGQHNTDLIQAFTDAMTSDDIERIVNLFDPGCEWVIMATGETFRGRDKIRQLATRTVAARNHPAELGIKPINVFTNPERTKLCWEYVHKALITDKWSASASRQSLGTKFELPIVLTCEIRQGKLVKVREYFDMLTALEPGTAHRLYS